VQRRVPTAQRATCSEDPVAEQERGSQPTRGCDEPRHRLQQDSEPCHSGCDEERIGERADDDDHEHVLTSDALPQDEDVLRADGDDEGQAEAEACEERDHASTLGRDSH
jgi:hypothetical protein